MSNRKYNWNLSNEGTITNKERQRRRKIGKAQRLARKVSRNV